MIITTKLTHSVAKTLITKLLFWKRFNKKQKLYFHLILGALFVILIPLLITTFQQTKSAQAAWLDDNWSYRKTITTTITSSSSDISNLQTLLTIDTSTGANGIASGKIQTSCQDLRFTNVTGKLLPYYIDSGCGTTSTKVWVMADLVPKNTTTYTMYMYYGNPSAIAGSNSQPYFDNVVNLKGYWTMNESSGATVKDSSITANNGTATGTTVTTHTNFSNARTFPGGAGDTDYVTVSDHANLNPTTQITIEAWVYQAASQTDKQIIIKNMTNGNGGYRITATTGGKFHATLPTSGFNNTLTTAAYSTSAWHHVAFTYDGANIKIYVDGQLDNSVARTGSIGTGDGTTSLYFGRYTNNLTNANFNGNLDDVKIYSTARTAAQVLNDYNNTLPNGTSINIASAAVGTSNPSTSFATEEKAPSPIAYWKLDDGTGTNAQDSTANNLDGTLNNTPTWQTEDQCIAGKCLWFSGTANMNVSKADDAKLDFAAADNFTVSAWVKRNGASSANNFIITKAQSGYTGYKMYQDASGDYCFDVSDGTSTDTACTSAVDFDDDKWHLVQGVKSGTSSITLYVDGAQRAQDASIAATGTLANTGTFYIGVDLDGTSNEWLGFIDEVKVYPYARSAAQVKTDYDSKGSVKGSSAVIASDQRSNLSNGLVGYWKMDEASGTTTAADSSGNSNTGTSTSSTNVTAGKFGNGRSFNGTNQYINSGNGSTLNITSAMTISAWVKLSNIATTDQIIVGNSDITQTTGREIIYQNSVFRFYAPNSNWEAANGTTNPSANIWYHVVGTYDRNLPNNNIKVYVNGTLEGQRTQTSGITHIGATLIGTRKSDYGFLNGNIDETRIYNRALSPAEISQLYNFAPGPIAHYTFDENTGSSVKDSSGNANTGTWYDISAADSFNRSNGNAGTADIGGSWSGSTSQMVVTSNQIGANASAYPTILLSNVALDNYTITVKVGTFAGKMIVSFRDSGNGNSFRFGWDYNYSTCGSCYVINKSVTGTSSNLTSSQVGTPSSGDIWKLTVSGNTFNFYVNDVLKLTATDSFNNTASGIGLGLWESTTSRFDNFLVKKTATNSNWAPGKFGSAGNFNASYVTAANSTTGVKTVSFWVNPTSNTTNLLTLSSSAYVTSSSGTVSATGFSSPTIYINGMVNGTITANSWNHVAITTETGITANAISLGEANGSFLTGKLDQVRFYNYARTQKQIVEDMNGGHPSVGSPVGSAIAHWKFDEGYLTTANDSSINSNSLTLSSASWTNSGKFNKAWNGTGSVWLSRADDADFDFAAADNLAISLWFKSDSATNPSTTEYLLDKESSSAGYAIYATTSGTICFGIDDDATWTPDDTACSTNDIYDNTWHHIVATKTGTSRIDLYVDGIFTASDTSLSATGTLANSDSLVLGDRDASNGTDEFNGDLDEVKIYRYALTADEVKIDMNRSSSQVLGTLSDKSTYEKQAASQEYCIPGDSTSCASPIAEWKFDEKQGTTANDSSGNAHTGTWSGTLGSQWAPGKFGSAGRFNGVNNYLNLSAPSSFGVNIASISFWVKSADVPSYPFAISNGGETEIELGQGSESGMTNEVVAIRRFNDAHTGYDIIGYTNSTRTELFDGKWHHVTVTFSGSSNGTKIYIDGISKTVSVSIGSDSGKFQGGTGLTTSFAVIGATGFLGSFTSNGTLFDQVRFYNYARTPAQIMWEYNRGAPIGHWMFDECQGSVANDSSGNSNTGTITPGAGTNTAVGTCTGSANTMWKDGVTGKYNSSLDFDGTDDKVAISTTPITDTSAWTMSAWIKPASLSQNGIVMYNNTGSMGFGIGGVPGEFAGATLRGIYDGVAWLITSYTFTDTINWHHVVMTRSGSTTTFYIDGRTLTGTTNSTATPTGSSTGASIGNSGSIRYFNGQIDEAQMYNYALTATQIKNLYNQGSAVRFGPSTGTP